MAIVGAASFVVVPAVGFTIWGITRNKNKPSDGEQNKDGNTGDGEQNSEQARIAKKNLDVIHKKFDDSYQNNKGASDKANNK